MKTFIRKSILFVALPVLLLEILFRVTPFVKYKYEERINAYWKVDQNKTVKFIFIGTSRVAAAVLEDYVSKTFTDGVAINAGRGYTTSAIHYLGLKYLVEKKHADLKNSRIFFETPSGNCIYTDNWETCNWVNSKSPHLIIPFLDLTYMGKFWRLSSNSFFEKVNVTLLYFSDTYKYLSFIKEIMNRNSFTDLLIKTGLVTLKEKGQLQKETLTGKGGIKSDTSSVKKGRDLAKEYYSDFLASMKPISSDEYKKSIFNEMCTLVKSNGGQVGLFSIPLSSVQKSAYESEIAQKNAQEFRTFTSNKGIMVLDFDFKTTDEDFPDLWHISRIKATEYTQKMLEVLKENVLFSKMTN